MGMRAHSRSRCSNVALNGNAGVGAGHVDESPAPYSTTGPSASAGSGSGAARGACGCASAAGLHVSGSCDDSASGVKPYDSRPSVAKQATTATQATWRLRRVETVVVVGAHAVGSEGERACLAPSVGAPPPRGAAGRGGCVAPRGGAGRPPPPAALAKSSDGRNPDPVDGARALR